MVLKNSIGIFDSGLGGLTILNKLLDYLPNYDFTYLGDNARVPYGNRSFDVVYQFTREAVFYLLKNGCPLVIVACNTASAKALRNIQQLDLPIFYPDRRVLGVIRPTTESIDHFTKTGHVGVLATEGTVKSLSYQIEIEKMHPNIVVHQSACPLWVPIIENQEHESEGADYFVKKYMHNLLSQSSLIDTIILGCTHYPLLLDKIKKYCPPHVQIVTQGRVVAEKLVDYLYRHPEIDNILSKTGKYAFLTTDDASIFDVNATQFISVPVTSQRVLLIN